ncbi:MAG: hypothetical protein M1817_002838 [Caeruleum heppii]|nr:MAG: hypothetical protein M1817_002838 [Caeruleum heppii]
MKDPFSLPASLFTPLRTFLVPSPLKRTTLPFHVHEIILLALFYQVLFTTISPVLSAYFFPRTYPAFKRSTKLNWDVHVVSLVQSLFISSLAAYLLLYDEERRDMSEVYGWRGRVWGYSGAVGMTQACAAGYFLWDLWVSARHIQILGASSLMHAIGALLVTCLGFRPFVNYYGLVFILYELSTPFLNFHWFFDKLHLTGSRIQLYNGILLLTSFALARLVWGTYQSMRIYRDIWAALGYSQSGAGHRLAEDLKRMRQRGGRSSGVMRFGGAEIMPLWLAVLYLSSNTLLSVLNFYWFGKMIEALRKRFQPAKGGEGTSAGAVEGKKQEANGSANGYHIPNGPTTRRRG